VIFAEKNASADNATVPVCSDFREADSVPMPVGEAVKDSALFAPLTYYKLGVPAVGLPPGKLRAAAEIAGRNDVDAAKAIRSDYLAEAKEILSLVNSLSSRLYQLQ
jgi:hypothetical protein